MSNKKKRLSAQLVLLVSVLLLLMQSAMAAPSLIPAPALIPMPREYHSTGQVSLARGVSVRASGTDADDKFAAQDLAASLAERGIKSSAGGFAIVLLRSQNPQSAALLKEEKLAFDPSMNGEGYVLFVRAHSATVIGASSAGVFYGAQTLKQMVTGTGKDAELATGTVRDWPAMHFRGVDDDLSRGPFPTLAFQKHQIAVLAAFKVNIYSPYFEHTLAYEANPLAAPPNSAMSKADVTELVRFARQYHITVIPEQEAFGHLHHVLKYEAYSTLAETPHGHVLSPVQPGSIELIKSWFGEIAAEFPSPFIHIGADETFELGTGQTKPEVDRRGLGPVYADFLTQIDAALKPLHRKLLYWGDIAMNDPTAVSNLPKDMIALPWVYGPEKSYTRYIQPFVDQHIETWVAPGDSNWNVVYPIADNAFRNIQGFVRDGQHLGSTGALTTVWNDDGEGLFNQDWYGVLFGAAASWQPGESDIAQYQSAFAPVFYGDLSGKLDRAHREIMAAQALIGGDDTTFWLDPWSPAGQLAAQKLRPRIHEMRLHAEQALILLHQARSEQPGLQEQDALLGLELGARRLDFIGMKFQLADEMAGAYAKAFALPDDGKHNTEKRELLYSITSMNGRCQDLRDGYSQLKELYRQLWLTENRPYWLDNVLVRYDLQIQKWQQRADDLNTAINDWQQTKHLPAAEKVGIPPPPPQ
jgi:hexosaminidase